RVLFVHFVGVERPGVEERVRDHVLFAAGVLDVGPQQLGIEQVSHAQAAPAHFVFVSRANATRGGANLHPPRRVLGGQLDHAVVGQNDVSAIADEQVAIHFHARLSKPGYFLEKGDGVEHHAIADYASAAEAQHAAGNQLQHEFLAVDDDGVAGVVAAGVAGYDG